MAVGFFPTYFSVLLIHFDLVVILFGSASPVSLTGASYLHHVSSSGSSRSLLLLPGSDRDNLLGFLLRFGAVVVRLGSDRSLSSSAVQAVLFSRLPQSVVFGLFAAVLSVLLRPTVSDLSALGSRSSLDRFFQIAVWLVSSVSGFPGESLFLPATIFYGLKIGS